MVTRGKIIGAGLLALVLTACGHSGLGGHGQPGGPSFAGYLGSGNGYVEFLSLHPQGDGSYSGDFIIDQSQGTGDSSQPYQFNSNDNPATMTVSGGNVTLQVGGILGSTFYGSLSGGTLTLEVPNTDTGTISTGTLTASSSAAFNSAVASLKSQIATANTAAEATARNQQDYSQAQSDVSTLQSDLGSNGYIAGDLSTLKGDVGTIAGDIGTLKSDLNQSGNSYCSNQIAASSDANAADSDTGAMGSDVQAFQQDIGNIRQDIRAVKSDLSTLKAYGITPPQNAASTVTAAQNAITNAISKANGYISQGDAEDQQAYSIAGGAAVGSCSGDGPGKPSGLVKPIH